MREAHPKGKPPKGGAVHPSLSAIYQGPENTGVFHAPNNA